MGLRDEDLIDMVDHIFEIDSYASKMGDDKNIVTLSFSVRTKAPADDLMSFIERGYPFVLDSDVTTGEQSDGTYKVFVEIERNKEVPEQIVELIDGVSKLTSIKDFKFRYYKNFRSKPCTLDNLTQTIPVEPEKYGIVAQESKMQNYTNFFNKSYVEQVSMNDDVLHIKKSYAEPLSFKVHDSGSKEEVLERLKETVNPWDFAEVIFLSKYIGDYNITKFGSKFMLENSGTGIIVERLS
jgi:hypothetical protein